MAEGESQVGQSQQNTTSPEKTLDRRTLLKAGGAATLLAGLSQISKLPTPEIRQDTTNSADTGSKSSASNQENILQEPESTPEQKQPDIVSEIHQNLLETDLVRGGDFSSVFKNLSTFREKQKKSSGQDPNKYFIINSKEEGSKDFEKIDQDSGSTPDVLDLELTTSQDGVIIFREGPTHSRYGSKQIDVDPSLKGKRVRAVRILGDEYGDSNTLGRLTVYSDGEPYYGGAFYGLISSEQNSEGAVDNFFCDTNGNRLETDQPPICFSRTFCNPIN